MARRFRIPCWATLLILLAVSRPAAATVDQFDGSLPLIPDDAGFYVAALRAREQVEAARNSRAWAIFLASPAVIYSRDWFQSRAANPATAPGRLAAIYRDPLVRRQIERLAELCSQEVFVWADRDFVATLRRVQVPRVVVGFRVADPARFQQQLDALGLFLKAYGLMDENWRGRVGQEQIGSGRYLVVSLDGRMLLENGPARRLIQRLALDKSFISLLGELLQQRKLVIAVGLREKYLLFSAGESTAALARLGSGPRLIDRPELKLLAPFVGKRVTGVLYAGTERPFVGITFWEDGKLEGYLYRQMRIDGKQPAPQPARVWHWRPPSCPPEYDLAVELLPVLRHYVERRVVSRWEPEKQAGYRRSMTALEPWLAGLKQIHIMVKLTQVLRGITSEARVENGVSVRHLRLELGDVD